MIICTVQFNNVGSLLILEHTRCTLDKGFHSNHTLDWEKSSTSCFLNFLTSVKSFLQSYLLKETTSESHVVLQIASSMPSHETSRCPIICSIFYFLWRMFQLLRKLSILFFFNLSLLLLVQQLKINLFNE